MQTITVTKKGEEVYQCYQVSDKILSDALRLIKLFFLYKHLTPNSRRNLKLHKFQNTDVKN